MLNMFGIPGLALILALACPWESAMAKGEPLPGAAPYAPELAKRMDEARRSFGADYSPRTRHLREDGRAKYTNRLVLETSPYLRQHAHNPVNWYPWGDEAFEAARRLKRPVLLSVGYSTCHWCHVMEEKSFENEVIARYLNEHYVAIKVDREVRPDIDSLYMASIYSFSGSGGWPMTVWLTPDRKPFYGGTYFPPEDMRMGERSHPGFLTLLREMKKIYAEDPEQIAQVTTRVMANLQQNLVLASGADLPDGNTMSQALDYYRKAYDPVNGGLQRTTKFPSSLPIRFLLREHRRTGAAAALSMAEQTLDAMRRGGLYDHVGGGFHRYSTEPTWTVPHFEKMLYDNALLVPAYLEAYQVTGNQEYAAVARDVLDYVLREMTSPEGTFYSATDADSEGEEGRFFVWSTEELRAAAEDELAELALLAYGVRTPGNFDAARSVLRRDASAALLAKQLGSSEAKVEAQLETIRERLRVARAKRVPPLRDEKQIVSWNGLMISALARGGQVLDEPRFVAAAERAAATLLRDGLHDGVLSRYLRDGKAYGGGLLSDYAFLEAGVLDLFEATSDPRWLDAALLLQGNLDRRFWDEAAGGYFVTASDGEALLVREKNLDDGAEPSGNSVAVMNLLRLHSLVSEEVYLQRATKSLRAFSDFLKRFPAGAGEMLLAVDYFLDTPKEILIVAPASRAQAEPFTRELMLRFVPNRVHLAVTGAEAKSLAARVPLLEGKRAIRGKVTAFVCVNQTCEQPVSTLEDFAKQLGPKPERPGPLPF